MNVPPGADTRPILTESMFQAICAAGGWKATPRQRGGLTTWAPKEGTPVWIYNPFATEWPDGVSGVRRSTWNLGLGFLNGQWNADGTYGVGIYASEIDGARATAFTIRQVPPQFSFKPIADWIDADCVISDALRPSLVANMRSWGTGGFADLIATGWQPPSIDANGAAVTSTPDGSAALTDDQVTAVTTIAKALIDGSIGPIFLALLRQVLGLDESTYGATYTASVAEVRAKVAPSAQLLTVYDDIGRLASQFGTAVQAAGRARQS